MNVGGKTLKWERTRHSDQSSDHLTEERQMAQILQRDQSDVRLTDTGSARHLNTD